jgi:hypothetical protein
MAFRIMAVLAWVADPDWIRIQSGQWIRIRNLDPDPGGQKWPTKVEKFLEVHVLKCWMQCCGTGTVTVGTVTFCLVEPEPKPEP